MTKRIAAILMCAVMVLVAAAPMALATHDVIKGAQGPRASAVTWEYVPAGYGTWTGHIVNDGLRSLAIDVDDNTTGTPVLVSHQKFRFALYPDGWVNTSGVVMAADHKYEITAVPNGPKGSSCKVDDVFKFPDPPVAVITVVSVDYLNIVVNGDLSSGTDGLITSYDWDFGDGFGSTGMDASHSYAEAGDYTIMLMVTDTNGLAGWDYELVSVEAPPAKDTPPVAAFTYTVSGMTVNVDAFTSSDDNGINAYNWTWGDGTTGSGMTATHTYATSMVSASALSGRAPVLPHAVLGTTYGPDGVTIVGGCDVTIKDLRTGDLIYTTSSSLEESFGIYSVDLSNFATAWEFNDSLEVTAKKDTMVGTTIAPITDNENGYDVINVVLLSTGGSMLVTITLTVTDTIGQTASRSEQVTLTW